MKPAAAFAVGLWAGAAVMAGVGGFYFSYFSRHRSDAPPRTDALWESRYVTLQQEQVKAAAEAQRLRQTVAELRAQLAATPPPPAVPAAPEEVRHSRQLRLRAPEGAAGIDRWIIESVLAGDPQALPKLEQAAAANPDALDALALLAPQDNAEALTRVWASNALDEASRARATLLLAATLEVNALGDELLLAIATNPALVEAALAGLGTPNFATRLARGTGIRPPPVAKPDYLARLRIVDALRTGIADEGLAAVADRVRERLADHATEAANAAP
jgi:hypothetical protein